MYIVILAGGSGTRFWPLSRKKTPKQLMSVFGGRSMLQRTVERVLSLNPEGILVVTNELQASETERQLSFVPDDLLTIVKEPLARNTAPAIGLAAAIIASRDPTAVMAVLPADHFIQDEEAFRTALERARLAAADMTLVTLGIRPVSPETGYGYIEADLKAGREGVFPVSRFIEKPHRGKAMELLAAGNYYWNSGMFVWRADVIMDRLRTHMPDLFTGLENLRIPSRLSEHSLARQVEALYTGIAAESIDYGVMEKSDGVVVIPSSFGWSDVGSWSALPGLLEGDEHGNVVVDKSTIVPLDSHGCLVLGGEKLVALLGVRDLVVVDTGDALLVCPKDRAQEVKSIVDELAGRGLTGYL